MTTEKGMTDNPKKCLLDGVPITPWDLIAKAQTEGYTDQGWGLYSTSGAAYFLRTLGYVVGDNIPAQQQAAQAEAKGGA